MLKWLIRTTYIKKQKSSQSRNIPSLYPNSFLNSYLPGHPGNIQIGKVIPNRDKKPTIQFYRNSVDNLIPITNKKDLKKKQKILHTKSVTYTIDSYIPNKVLDQKPPAVSKKEENLSRNSRVLLSQLRSGYSRMLNSYLHRINDEIEDKCPKCNTGPHTTEHLFNCPMNPTNLTPTDLWTNPDLVASFLDLDESGVT